MGKAQVGDQLVGVAMHTIEFNGTEWVCVCGRFRTVDVLVARQHAGLPAFLSVTPPTPETARLDTEECSHPAVMAFSAADGSLTLWACEQCRRRFYPACPVCVVDGHRSGEHPESPRRIIERIERYNPPYPGTVLNDPDAGL